MDHTFSLHTDWSRIFSPRCSLTGGAPSPGGSVPAFRAHPLRHLPGASQVAATLTSLSGSAVHASNSSSTHLAGVLVLSLWREHVECKVVAWCAVTFGVRRDNRVVLDCWVSVLTPHGPREPCPRPWGLPAATAHPHPPGRQGSSASPCRGVCFTGRSHLLPRKGWFGSDPRLLGERDVLGGTWPWGWRLGRRTRDWGSFTFRDLSEIPSPDSTLDLIKSADGSMLGTHTGKLKVFSTLRVQNCGTPGSLLSSSELGGVLLP